MKSLKTLMTMAILFATTFIYAQAPNAFNYQAAIRDGAGNLITMSNVGLRFSIEETTANGNSVYVETKSGFTNEYGMISSFVGKGTVVSGDFTTIDWGSDKHFLRVEIDVNGGTNYQYMGSFELLSVPYAIHAASADNATTSLDNLWQRNVNDMHTKATNMRVGIGVTAPGWALDVDAFNVNLSPSTSRRYFDANNSLIADVAQSGNIAIYARGAVLSEGGAFVATSDARIKNIIGKTNAGKDLGILNQIGISDYKFTDEIRNGSGMQKKVIAQQVNEVYPQAIMITKGTIPNVYEMAKKVTAKEITTQITTDKKHDLVTGDMVKLVLEAGVEKTLAVTVKNAHTFSVEEVINDRVFVYGKEVDDLLSVDYDAISMLNVSATQELSKQLDALKAEVERLNNENIALKAENGSYKEDINLIKTQLGLDLEGKK